MESGESPQDALIREIQEELGIAIHPLSERESISIGATPIPAINLDQEKDQEIQLQFLYALAVITTQASSVHDSVLWMSQSELECAMLPGSGYNILPSNQTVLQSVLQMGLLRI